MPVICLVLSCTLVVVVHTRADMVPNLMDFTIEWGIETANKYTKTKLKMVIHARLKENQRIWEKTKIEDYWFSCGEAWLSLWGIGCGVKPWKQRLAEGACLANRIVWAEAAWWERISVCEELNNVGVAEGMSKANVARGEGWKIQGL